MLGFKLTGHFLLTSVMPCDIPMVNRDTITEAGVIITEITGQFLKDY